MWSDESLFQSDGCIKVRRNAAEVIHTLCLVPTYKPLSGVLQSGVVADRFWLGLGVQRIPEYIDQGPHLSNFLAWNFGLSAEKFRV